ncbi:hypothetical protein PUN28_002409 [Cardiocondyla obscurior]|uniref:Secreted protein n=1 Tax=Cardiocondyla obscurior TaxID=286306 RepID=A0AAW2GTZ9_9HYME
MCLCCVWISAILTRVHCDIESIKWHERFRHRVMSIVVPLLVQRSVGLPEAALRCYSRSRLARKVAALLADCYCQSPRAFCFDQARKTSVSCPKELLAQSATTSASFCFANSAAPVACTTCLWPS